MKKDIRFESLPLNSKTKEQINQSVDCVQEIFGKDLSGVYLYGSALVGGLQKYRDIDLLVVLSRSSTAEEKKALINALLSISGIYMKSIERPIEITIIEKAAVNPWRYPPVCDFQYGEWLREAFENGEIALSSSQMPDLAVLITQVLLASCTLFGSDPEQLLCKVPYKDFIQATANALPLLMSEVESDTRNVLLTLARIWCSISTDTIQSKPAAAEWAIERLPEKYHSVMRRAQAICKGEEKEHWDDLQELIKPCTQFMSGRSNDKITEIMLSNDSSRSISIASK